MTAAQIRQPVLRGRQAVAAIWFPSDWFDPATRAKRLIACWRPGATALRFAQGDLLCYAAAIDEDCDDLPGWPLRQEGRALCSAPLSDLERASIPAGDIWIVLGAEVLALQVRDALPLDPATWLAVRQLALHDTYDCSITLSAPVVLDLESRPLREVLGNAVAPASQERAELMAALRQAQRQRANNPPQDSRPQPGSNPTLFKNVLAVFVVINILRFIAAADTAGDSHILWVLPVMAALVFWLGGWGGSLSRWFTQTVSDLNSTAARQGTAASDSLPERRKQTQPQRWRQWLARMAMTSQLARLIGRAQARYVRRMLGLFDEGNLAEALRHAIPLGGDGGSLGQAFGTPGRRMDLKPSLVNGPATDMNLGAELQNHLRQLYRRTFEKLDREGRTDEAVFVLAELLNAKQEALDYLEKKQRFAQAAELALGWDRAADVIVRLHCLAGDWRRAVAVARRDGAFANAVLQLEKRWPDAARRLREEWGRALTQQGDWLGAVEAVWPVESLRAQATEWLLTAESAGGKLAARALVQRALLLPATLERYAEYLKEIQCDRALSQERLSMAEALISVGQGQASRELAALIAPALLADHAQGQRHFDKHMLQQLLRLTDDVLLQADLPTHGWPVVQLSPMAKRAAALCLEGPDAGAHAILDAVPLHDQRYLIALGEAGAIVVDDTGRTRAHFAIPAQRLVLAGSRQVALLLARRNSMWRVSRLDLAQRSIVDLGLCQIDHFAPEFDGLNWTVAHNRSLQVLDSQHSLREVVWQVTDLPGVVRALTASATLEQVVLEADGALAQLWMYQLPQRRLLSRDDVPLIDDGIRLLNPTGGLVDVAIEQPTPDEILLRWQAHGKKAEFRLQATVPPELRLWIAGEWLVTSLRTEAGYLVQWVLLASGIECARVQWPANCSPNVRCCASEWLLFDVCGRFMSIDVSSGRHRSLSVR